MSTLNIWNILCDKIKLHNECLVKHRELIKLYLNLSQKRLGLESDNIKNKTTTDINKPIVQDNDSNNSKLNISIAELERNIQKLRNMQDKLYKEIKDYVTESYNLTDGNYSDIEKLFRENDLDIYLVADRIDKSKLVPGTDLLDKHGTPVEYKVDIIVTDSNLYYLEQLGLNYTLDDLNDKTNKDIIIETVQQNFVNLSLSGDISVINQEAAQNALHNMIHKNTEIEDLNSY